MTSSLKSRIERLERELKVLKSVPVKLSPRLPYIGREGEFTASPAGEPTACQCCHCRHAEKIRQRLTDWPSPEELSDRMRRFFPPEAPKTEN